MEAFDAAGNNSNSSNIVSIITDPDPDTEAPSAPTALTASNLTETSVDLTWNASNDNVGVSGYDIYQDNVIVGTSNSTNYSLTNLTAATSYSFYVTAKDAAGNVSAASNVLSVTTPSASGPTVLHEGYFENGWDGWIDGGSDCNRYSGGRSPEGSYSIRIRDNSGTSSSMTSPSFDLSSYNQVDVEFSFYAHSMENGEDFWLRYYDGSSWQTVESYARGTDFQNGQDYTMTVSISSNNYSMVSNAQFRFQCDASGNNDHIYIDAVMITAYNSNQSLQMEDNMLAASVHMDHTISDFEAANMEEERIESRFNDTKEVSSALDFMIFPNPATDRIQIQLKGLSWTPEQFQIFTMNGTVIPMNIISQDQEVWTVDVSHLESGMYIIRSIDSNHRVQTKLFNIVR